MYQISIRIRHILSMNCCKTLMIQAQREPSSFLNRGSLSLFIMAQGIFRCLTRQKKTAITSVANSNKTEASIGKFGVGFKAVFQYTSTPHIYDPDFRFKIERFIVPVELDGDFPARRHDETLFVFPFDHPERTAEQAYEDIAEKLRHLTYPLLFMSSLKEIEFEIGDVIGLYSKRICETCSFGNITAQKTSGCSHGQMIAVAVIPWDSSLIMTAGYVL